jgi:hypothetical protein
MVAFLTWLELVLGSPVNMSPFDTAIIRFEQPELIAALQAGWRFLSPKDLSPIRADMPNCFVAGYPRVTTRKAGWEFSPKFFCFVSSLLSEVPEDANEVREGLDIFLQHRESGEDLDGGTSEVPNLKGVSGASIWGVVPNSGDCVWSAESRLRVIECKRVAVRARTSGARIGSLLRVFSSGLMSEPSKRSTRF